MKKYEPSLNDRLKTAAKARRSLLEKAQKNAPVNDPDFADRQAARVEVAAKREARIAERTAAKIAEKERQAKEQVERERAQAEALEAEEKARVAEAEEEAAREIAHQAELKAKRDRRYAARKAR